MSSDIVSPIITGPGDNKTQDTNPNAVVSKINSSENIKNVFQFSSDEEVTWSIVQGYNFFQPGGILQNDKTFKLKFKTQQDNSILDVGGNTDYSKGFINVKMYAFTNGAYKYLVGMGLQNGYNYAGQTLPWWAYWPGPQKWNKTDPVKIDFQYIDSKGYIYIDHYYIIDGQFTDTPTNPQLLGVNDKNDFNKFDIDPKTGSLSFKNNPDFENPGDIDGNNIYKLKVKATDTAGNESFQDVEITLKDVEDSLLGTEVDDTPPIINGPGGNKTQRSSAGLTPSTITIDENNTAIFTFTANEAITWAFDNSATYGNGGPDKDKFTLDSSFFVPFNNFPL